jgi:hypothetical protein
MVGIIPKPIKKTSKLYELAPYISFGLVVLVILTYGVLFFIENRTSKTLWELEDKIAQVGTKDEKNLETQLLLDKQKIDDFSNLFADHTKASEFFKFLEENCHPKIWFNKFELSTQDSQVILTGETSNFETLGQQMVIFKGQETIMSIEISDLSVAKNGRANFTISLSLDPKIFKYNE